MADKGCGEGDVRDQCEAIANASRTDSLVGAGNLATWTGSSEAEINRHLVAPSCLLHTKVDGTFHGTCGNREVVDLIRISSDGESDIHDDLDVDVAVDLKGKLYLPNGGEKCPVTINDLAMQ